ncbi:UNVERIFIED_CONTAM: Cysteine proteinase inhibitor 4 [Sesamum radiatum]|uniref:Cysteine proteinase inhibitor 4 n=1 Tax=Sesamum radiatum TaxID=300843 RepID=A0AAW2T257_SESRA
MALKSFTFIMVSAFLMASSNFGVSAAFTGGRKALVPAAAPALSPDADYGFVPLNTKDPNVVGLAKFALDEYNKISNGKLVFTALFEAILVDTAQGTAYRFVIAATDLSNQLNDYDAKVLVQKDSKKLVFFKENQ